MQNKLDARQKRLLERLNKKHNRNQAIADRILTALDKRHASVVIMVSSNGLRFLPKDVQSAKILVELLSEPKMKQLTKGKNLLRSGG